MLMRHVSKKNVIKIQDKILAEILSICWKFVNKKPELEFPAKN